MENEPEYDPFIIIETWGSVQEYERQMSELEPEKLPTLLQDMERCSQEYEVVRRAAIAACEAVDVHLERHGYVQSAVEQADWCRYTLDGGLPADERRLLTVRELAFATRTPRQRILDYLRRWGF